MNKILKKTAVSTLLVAALAIGGAGFAHGIATPSGGGNWPTPIQPKVPVPDA